MELFNQAADVAVNEEKDTLGGFAPWESNLYKATLKCLYLGTFAGGSKYVNAVVELEDADGNKREIQERETVWSAKTQGTYYIDKKDQSKKELLGKTKMDALLRMLAGVDLASATWEKKTHKVRENQQDVNKPFDTITNPECINVPIYVGLKKVIENKNTKVGDKYVPTNEERAFNTIDRYFNEDKKTSLEVKKDKPAEFYETWAKANAGKDRNKFKEVKGGAPAAGIPQATAAPLSFDN